MSSQFERTESLIGNKALAKLSRSTVAIFGIGGVGSFAVEALVRSGVGKLVLIDSDVIALSNLNRQIHATHQTIGQAKVQVMKERILTINPSAKVVTHQSFYRSGAEEDLISSEYDYIIDAIDTVGSKVNLICQAQQLNIPLISSMGAANKIDPTRFRVADIYDTSVCPLARVMRRELRKAGIRKLKVVYSTEPVLDCSNPPMENSDNGQAVISEPNPFGSVGSHAPASIAFVPSVAGLIIAGEVIKDLISWNNPPNIAKNSE
jgi:tRNA threonylcarbamoyladenosine dehydratase